MHNQKKRLLQLFSLKVIIICCIFFACVVLFATIADEVVLEQEKGFDDAIFTFFGSVTSPSLVHLMWAFTFLGSTKFLLPAYIVLAGCFLIQKKSRYCIEIAVTGLASQALLYALKQIFHRQRPALPLIKNITTYSFPSGHTFSSFIFCSTLIYIIQHLKWKNAYKWITSILLILFSITIGVSRIILKVHYPTDVIASLLLGIAWVICVVWLLKRMNEKYEMNEMQ